MRCFLAVGIPEDLRSEIAGCVDRLRRRTPKARWVRPGALHCTLVFLGEQSEETLGELSPGWRAVAAATEPFSLDLVGPGAFPPRGRCRTLWLGLEPVAAIAELRRELVREAATVLDGEGLDGRPYHPHVTIARCRRPWSRRWMGELEETFGDLRGEVPVDAVALYESELRPDGARYRVADTFVLGDPG